MKALAIWVVAIAVVFGAFAVIANLMKDTSQVFVVVDSSFPMNAVWAQVPGELDDIDDEDDAEFALATEKEAIHTWQSELTLGSVEPFAPCDFEAIGDYPEVAEADDLILITTDTSCDTTALTEWEIIVLTP